MEPIEQDGVVLYDAAPAAADLREAAIRGLSQRPRSLPCKFFYDEEGSRLFDEICELEEYYVTRTEAAIMEASVDDMAVAVGPHCRLVEFGSGSSTKTRRLLDALDRPAAYVPIDISRDHLLATAVELQRDYPDLPVQPVAADYTEDLTLPPVGEEVARTVVYFPGSTLGNFAREEASVFLGRIRRMVGDDGGVLIGIDQVKDRDVLRRAYNDSSGVTAAFNRNILVRLGREADVALDPGGFEHRAVWDEEEARIEMQLVARGAQRIRVGESEFEIADGEAIVTEHSHKYTDESFATIAERAGLAIDRRWSDPRGWFAVYYLGTV